MRQWRKASMSNPSGNCVEVAGLPDGGAAIRHSKHPDGPVIEYSRDEIRAFMEGVKAGEFDHLLT